MHTTEVLNINEKIVEKLEDFGLSQNQATIYSYLIKFGYTSVKEISEATSIHSQDVYKTLKQLEKKGLLLKTEGKPLKLEVIPVQEGLNQLILSAKQELKTKIKTLETDYQYIKETAKTVKHEAEGSYIFLLQKGAPPARIDLAFENLRVEYDLLWPDGPFPWIEYLQIQLSKIAKRRARTRILIFSSENEFPLANALEKIMPKSIDFEVRTLQCDSICRFALIDFREVWLPVHSIGKGAIVITDAEEIVLLAKQQFESLWNDPKTKIRMKSTADLNLSSN
jgi:sugar-specific transcriptional regulator TrmB